MAWNPDSISPEQMNELRQAAEKAWGDDTRNEGFVGHPDPSQGHCFVTAQWLAHRLGGYVGAKKGHFFWVSPDKKYVMDLCGDWFSHPVHQQPGPVMFKRATHSMWKGFRIMDDYPEHPRAQLFERRANAAMHHLAKLADNQGYPGDEPYVAQLWHGSPTGKLGPIRPGFFATSHLPEAEDYGDTSEYFDPEDRGKVFPVTVNFQRPYHYYGRWPGTSVYQSAREAGHDGVVVHFDPDESDPSNPVPAREWVYALHPRTVTIGHAKTSDLAGPTPYTGETPQQQEDWNLSAPLIHDEPGFDMASGDHTYQWIVANNQVHVSPAHSQDELAGRAQFDLNSREPFAAGQVEVKDGHATWSVTTNISMRLLSNMLRGYSETVGWKFDGLVDPMGQEVHDDFGAHKSMYYSERHDGHLVMSETPLPHGKRVDIQGKTARVGRVTEGLQEWADDFGYRLAEWPGGGDMTDQMKTREHLDEFNRGDMKFQPERSNPDLDIENADLSCGKCGEEFDSMAALRMHHRDHEPHDEPLDQAKFPWPHDFDAPLGFGTQQVPQSQWDGTVAMVLPGWKVASRYPEFGQQIVNVWNDDWRFYGAYRSGQLIGYAAVDDRGSVGAIHTMRSDDTERILRLIQTHYEEGSVLPCNKAQESLLPRLGMVPEEWPRGIWKWAKGQEPKDLITSQIPFVYDVQGNKDHRQGMISLGYPGQGTHEVMPRGGEKFTPGGIVEGIYEPGGKVTFISQTNVPWTTRQFAQLWYALYPQMEITSVERQLPDGSTHKLAGIKVADKLHDFLMNPKSRPDLQTPEGQQFLETLKAYHNEKTDPLMPWLTREWKKGRLGHHAYDLSNAKQYPSYGGREYPGRLMWHDPTSEHRANPWRKDHWEQLHPDIVNHWADFLRSNHPIRRQLGDIMQHDVGSFHQQHIGDWDQAMKDAAEQKALEGGKVVHTTPEGYTIRQLTTPEELTAEGNSMGHCVGGYDQSVADGDSLIYSLRDPKGIPHATTEIAPGDVVGPEYDPEWLDKLIAGQPHNPDRMAWEAAPYDHLRQPGVLEGVREYKNIDENAGFADRPEHPYRELYNTLLERHGYTPAWGTPSGGNVVQIQGKANDEPIPEYKQQLRNWFESFPEEVRPQWGGDYYGADYLEDPRMIKDHHLDPNALDEYGLKPLHPTPDYDALLQGTVSPPVYQRSYDHYEHDLGERVYALARAHGQIPELAGAVGSFGDKQQEDFDNWFDMNEHNVSWPDLRTDEYNEMSPDERSEAFDAASDAWRDEQAQEHPGMQATTHLYSLINPHWNPETQQYENEPSQGAWQQRGVFR